MSGAARPKTVPPDPVTPTSEKSEDDIERDLHKRHEDKTHIVGIMDQSPILALDCVKIAEFLVETLNYTFEEIVKRHFRNSVFDKAAFNDELTGKILNLTPDKLNKTPMFKKASYIVTIVKTINAFIRSGGKIKQLDIEEDSESEDEENTSEPGQEESMMSTGLWDT